MSDAVRGEAFQELPVMPLREVVMFPRSIMPLFVGREASIKAIEAAQASYSKQIFRSSTGVFGMFRKSQRNQAYRSMRPGTMVRRTCAARPD